MLVIMLMGGVTVIVETCSLVSNIDAVDDVIITLELANVMLLLVEGSEIKLLGNLLILKETEDITAVDSISNSDDSTEEVGDTTGSKQCEKFTS